MARGTSTVGDIVPVLGDGTETNALWRESQAALVVQNGLRDSLRALLTYPTTFAGEDVIQVAGGDDFEEASEFGEPKGLRAPTALLRLGFGFKDFDTATRFTWKFLRDAAADQVRAVVNLALEADNRLVFNAVMGALFNPAARVNPEARTVFSLYNADGTVPPAYAGITHLGTHTHYVVSGGAVIDGGDLVDLIDHVSHHGYAETGRLLLLCHPNQGKAIRGFRVASGAPFDFIPSQAAPPYLTDQMLVGDKPPAAYGRIAIAGAYGPAWVAEHPLIPAGYVLAVASDGAGSARNPVGFREHQRPEYRGLRQIPGGSPNYPLTDSFYQRSFGTGVRHRGAAAVMQIKATGTYDVPAIWSSVIA